MGRARAENSNNIVVNVINGGYYPLRRRYGCLSSCLSVVILSGLLVWGCSALVNKRLEHDNETQTVRPGTTPEETARQRQAEEEAAARKQAAVEANRKPQEEAKRQLEERAKQAAEKAQKEAAEKAPLILKQAQQSVEKGNAAKAKDRHEEACTLFQQAVEHCEEIIQTASQIPAAAEAKGLLAEARKLLAEENSEAEAARKLALPKRLVQDGHREKTKGNIREANALFKRANLRLQEMIKTYPNTKAAAEAKDLLDNLH
jgi:hypothetical protein